MACLPCRTARRRAASSRVSGTSCATIPFGVVDFIGANNRFLVKLSQGAHEEFFWLDITAFNLAYWLGNTEAIHLCDQTRTYRQRLRRPAPSLEPVKVEGYDIELCWQPSASPGVTLTRLYRANPPDYLYTQVAELPASQACYSETLPGGWYGGFVYIVSAVNSSGVESGFSNSAWAPRLINPTAVTILPDGRSLILDAQNGYAILEQDEAGNYLGNLGSVHYHLELITLHGAGCQPAPAAQSPGGLVCAAPVGAHSRP